MKQWPLRLLRHAQTSFKPSLCYRPSRWSGDARLYSAAAGFGPATIDTCDWLQLSILTDDSNELDAKAVLSHVPSLGPSILSSTDRGSTVLLITKQFATWATEQSTFPQSVIEKLWHDSATSRTSPVAVDERQVRLVTAVVDKLPTARSPKDDVDAASMQGKQGVAILASSRLPLLGPSTAKPKNGAPARTDSLGSERPDIISFNIFTSHDAARPSPRPNISLALPAASTVFETGTPSTISDSLWMIGSGTAQKLSGQTQLASDVQVNLPVSISSPPPSPSSEEYLHPSNPAVRVSVPLIQLCAPRKVCASNGNVVTRTSSIEKDGEQVPASQELEAAVVDHLNSGSQSPGLVSVWALILPQECFTEREIDNMGENVIRDIGDLLARGARIHRVLSGGGGWGQKAGLLSLDPETSHTKNVESPSLDLGSDIFSALFKTVAKQGDFMGFLAATEVDPQDTVSSEGDVAKTYTFGVLPNAEFGFADASELGTEQNGNGERLMVTEEFGMLSEGGLSLHEHGPNFRSRLDVPHTRIYV